MKRTARIKRRQQHPQPTVQRLVVLDTVAGVVSVTSENERMVVQFRGGKTATVERCPLSGFSGRESFDVYLPSERAGFAAQVAPGKSAAEVIKMLNQLATKVA